MIIYDTLYVYIYIIFPTKINILFVIKQYNKMKWIKDKRNIGCLINNNTTLILCQSKFTKTKDDFRLY